MSQQSEVRRQTLQLCQQINEKCQIDQSKFTYDTLSHKDWYIEVLQILCPYLVDELVSAHKQKNQGKAIDSILQIINTLDEFNEDVTQSIKGKNIVAGDSVQIYYIVQVFAALLEEAIRQNQFNQEDQNASDQKKMQRPSDNMLQDYKTQKAGKSGIKSYNSDRQQKSGHHSVIGIRNQFDKSESSDGGQSQFNQYKQQPQITAYVNKEQNYQKDQQSDIHQQQSSQNYSDLQYLEQRLEETKMRKKTAIKTFKNPQKNKILYGNKKPKKLVEHPKTGKKLKKAKSTQAIKLTNQIRQEIRQEIKSPSRKPMKSSSKIQSPAQITIKKKQRQLQYQSNQYETHKKGMKSNGKKNLKSNLKTDAGLQKILNWRQAKLKQQQRQYEQSLRNKLQTQKQIYVAKINKLVVEMEKKKGVQDKKQFKQKLISENERAVRRMGALEQWYQDRMAILKENSQRNKRDRNLIQTGHKQIIAGIEKQLRKDNQEKLMYMTQKYRQESDYIQTDLDQLQKRILQVYKKY